MLSGVERFRKIRTSHYYGNLSKRYVRRVVGAVGRLKKVDNDNRRK